MKLILFLLLILFFSKSNALELGEVTGLKVPRYVSIKSNDANIRVGPSINYPIKLKYINENYPLKVVAEHEDWRKVEDVKKNFGWIHKSLISGKRTGIVIKTDNNLINVYNTVDGYRVGQIGVGNIINIKKCKINWCYITKNKQKGWVVKDNIWGIEEDEILNINFYQRFIDYYWVSFSFFKEIKNKI